MLNLSKHDQLHYVMSRMLVISETLAPLMSVCHV